MTNNLLSKGNKVNSFINRLTICVVCVTIIFAIVFFSWIVKKGEGNTMNVILDAEEDCTPTIVDQMKAIGQWEFLTISNEEIADTMRTGFFGDDYLVRIYSGTMRIGIDLSTFEPGWVETDGDTIRVSLPDVKLLDHNFIDEASARSFFESGKWSHADRKKLYEKARKAMIKRHLTKENLRIARQNAKAEAERVLQTIVQTKAVKVTIDSDEK